MTSKFFKSSYSGANQSCVEISHRAATVVIRDSKYNGPAASQPVVTVPASDWDKFTALALSGDSGHLRDIAVITVNDGGSASIESGDIVLAYRADEWDAFVKGVADGQFDRPQ